MLLVIEHRVPCWQDLGSRTSYRTSEIFGACLKIHQNPWKSDSENVALDVLTLLNDYIDIIPVSYTHLTLPTKRIV